MPRKNKFGEPEKILTVRVTQSKVAEVRKQIQELLKKYEND